MKSSPENINYELKKELKKFDLESDFEKLPIRVRQRITPGAKKIIIYAHGSFGEMTDISYPPLLLKQYADADLASTVELTTARRDSYWNGNYEGMINAFDGKTFDQEFSDVDKVVSHALENIEELVDDPSNTEIILIGLSLGGTFMTLLAHKYPQVHKLILISAGCRTKNRGFSTLMDSYPEEPSTIKDSAKKFNGEVVHIKPTDDKTVPTEYQDELFDAFQGKKKQISIAGAGHVFSFHQRALAGVIHKVIQNK